AKTHMDAAAPHSGHETPAGAQAKVNTHANSKQSHGISSGYYIAKTSRSDQLPAWNDIQGKPSSFTPTTHGNEAHNPAFALASDLTAHLGDNVKHITNAERTAWNNKLNASAYTAADVLAKVKTVDGDGSGLDADLLDGAHAGNGPNNVLKLDSGGLVPLPNIPGTLTGKSSDMVDGKHFSDIQNDAQAKADAALNSAKAYTDQEVGEVAQELAAHKAEIVSQAEPNKILRLDENGKLPADITGDAATVSGKSIEDLYDGAWEKIAEADVSNPVVQIDFFNIPSEYKNFKIFASFYGRAIVSFNNDLKSSNYSTRLISATTSTNVINTSTYVDLSGIRVNGSDTIIEIIGANKNKNKFLFFSSAFIDNVYYAGNGTWKNKNDAITSISLKAEYDNFGTGDYFILWGAK
ncbi:MAG: hypothetical protein GXZ03_08520, partial [Proteiniphilum sp.]|nr:hypothetical protein [Proteiniphilum sp.]